MGVMGIMIGIIFITLILLILPIFIHSSPLIFCSAFVLTTLKQPPQFIPLLAVVDYFFAGHGAVAARVEAGHFQDGVHEVDFGSAREIVVAALELPPAEFALYI